jgi:hypothetical protein
MSLSHSSSVVTNGLVFYYDMNNIRKSWKGAPTTNLITNGDFSNGSVSPWSAYNVAPSVISGVTPLPYPSYSSKYVMQFVSTSGTSGASLNVTGLCTVGQAYTFSFYGRLAHGPATTGATNAWTSSVTLTNVWRRFTFTFTYDVAKTTLYFYNLATGYTCQFTEFQLEQRAFATPFVSVGRSTTQAILDLTNNNTITATSLTYVSDNTFSFNGTGDSISINRTLTTPITICGFVKYTDQAKTANTFLNSYPHTVLGISLNRSGGGQLFVYIGNGTTWIGTPSITSSVNMTVNVWYHLAFVSNGTSSDLYLNGVNVGTVGHAPSGWGNYFAQGMIVQTGEYHKGSIATTQIYNRALSVGEIQQNFNAMRGRYGI